MKDEELKRMQQELMRAGEKTGNVNIWIEALYIDVLIGERKNEL